MPRIERPALEAITLRTGLGDLRLDPVNIAALEPIAGGTRVHLVGAGAYREVMETPEQVQRAVARVTLTAKQRRQLTEGAEALRAFGYPHLAVEIGRIVHWHERIQAAAARVATP